MAVAIFSLVYNPNTAALNPNAATAFQIVVPWGQTYQASTWEEVVNQAFFRNSRWSGKMGNFFNLSTTQGTSNVSWTVQTGTLTASAATITGLTSTAALQVGQPVNANLAGMPTGATIISINSATQVTMSANFTGTTGSASITFYPIVPISASDIESTP